ncbi:MAG: hypothetical protein LBN05_03450 [Oscillospiraceae bacterium]|jgi:hypothetical protein|nr:hypothetical protein [Oscillospiraceae bacterium]
MGFLDNGDLLAIQSVRGNSYAILRYFFEYLISCGEEFALAAQTLGKKPITFCAEKSQKVNKKKDTLGILKAIGHEFVLAFQKLEKPTSLKDLLNQLKPIMIALFGSLKPLIKDLFDKPDTSVTTVAGLASWFVASYADTRLADDEKFDYCIFVCSDGKVRVAQQFYVRNGSTPMDLLRTNWSEEELDRFILMGKRELPASKEEMKEMLDNRLKNALLS